MPAKDSSFGGGFWNSVASSAITTGIDVARGDMSWQDGLINVGKGAAISGVAAGASALGGLAGSGVNGLGLGGVTANVVSGVATSAINTYASAAINAFQFGGDNNGDWFNNDSFKSQTANAFQSMAQAGITSLASGIVKSARGATWGKGGLGFAGQTRDYQKNAHNLAGAIGGLTGQIFSAATGNGFSLSFKTSTNNDGFSMTFGGKNSGFSLGQRGVSMNQLVAGYKAADYFNNDNEGSAPAPRPEPVHAAVSVAKQAIITKRKGDGTSDPQSDDIENDSELDDIEKGEQKKEEITKMMKGWYNNLKGYTGTFDTYFKHNWKSGEISYNKQNKVKDTEFKPTEENSDPEKIAMAKANKREITSRFSEVIDTLRSGKVMNPKVAMDELTRLRNSFFSKSDISSNKDGEYLKMVKDSGIIKELTDDNLENYTTLNRIFGDTVKLFVMGKPYPDRDYKTSNGGHGLNLTSKYDCSGGPSTALRVMGYNIPKWMNTDRQMGVSVSSTRTLTYAVSPGYFLDHIPLKGNELFFKLMATLYSPTGQTETFSPAKPGIVRKLKKGESSQYGDLTYFTDKKYNRPVSGNKNKKFYEAKTFFGYYNHVAVKADNKSFYNSWGSTGNEVMSMKRVMYSHVTKRDHTVHHRRLDWATLNKDYRK